MQLMRPEEIKNIDESLLQCSATRPVPLNHNFYEEILEQNMKNPLVMNGSFTGNSDTDSQFESTARSSTRLPETAKKIVDDLMKENEQFITEAALKQAVCNSVNVNQQQYKDLIPISFDEEEFIRNYEANKGG